MAKTVGRGRGISTNVPEIELIEQVRIRPLLYDKNVKDYRKVRKHEFVYFVKIPQIYYFHIVARICRSSMERSSGITSNESNKL